MKTLDKAKTKPTAAAPQTLGRYAPKTHLGQRLWAWRQKYVADGGKLLDWDELEKEVALRKGLPE